MNQLTYVIFLKHKYMAGLSMASAEVKSIRMNLKVDDRCIKLNIVSPYGDNETQAMPEITEDNVQIFHEASRTFNKWLANKRHISHYDAETRLFEEQYPILPMSGCVKPTEIC